MVSPRTPKIVKRYGPSEGRNLVGSGNNTVALKKRFEQTSGGGRGRGRGVGGGVDGEVFDYLRASKNGSGNGSENNGWNNNWEDERGAVTEEMFLQRALAAIEEAGARGDGMVEMGEQEWRAWNRHEAMEREIEKRVAEREREREKQRERDLSRAEELQRELDMLRQTTITRTGTFGPSNGEPGFLVDQRLSPFGAGYASNSSSSSSLPAKITRPYSTFAASHRETRFVPDSADPTPAQNLRPTLPPRDQQRETYSSPPSRPLPSQQSSPALSHLQPAQPVSTTSRTASPRRSSSRSSSVTREGHRSKRSIASSTSVPPGVDLAPGGSYHPGAFPSIPTSKSTGALMGKSGKEGKKEKGKRGSDAEEDVYSSAAAALKDIRRRKRL